MKIRNLVVAIVSALGLSALSLAGPGSGPGPLAPEPAQAVEGQGNLKICVYYLSYTWMRAFKTDGSYSNQLVQYDDNGDDIGECTGWQTPSGLRVDTDPIGWSHSWRTKYLKDGGLDMGAWSWGSCHENSDNHEADPVNPPSNENWRIVYQNFDGGDCNDFN